MGQVVTAVSGQSYEDYVTENIIKPLKLSHTAPTLAKRVKAQLATGYSRGIPGEERKAFTNPEIHAMVSATGFSSNVLDLCKFMQAQFVGSGKF